MSSSGDAAVVNRSMFKTFAKATGLPNATANVLRKSATTNLRKDSKMSQKEPTIMDHSQRTADHYYDQSRTIEQVLI